MLSSLLDQPLESLLHTPLTGESLQEKQEVLAAMLIQNSFHYKNSDRVEAVKGKTYRYLEDGQEAKAYLQGLVSRILLDNLKGQESTLVKSFQNYETSLVVQEVLRAKDHF